MAIVVEGAMTLIYFSATDEQGMVSHN